MFLLSAALLLIAASCRFNPDLERFAECGEGGSCAAGQQCWTEENRCVPSCGEVEDCGTGAGGGGGGTLDDGGNNVVDAGEDAGVSEDGGFDDGGFDAGPGPLRLDGGVVERVVELLPFRWNFQAFGGQPPYQFGRVDGGYPPGLTLSADGELTGTPSTTGTYAFELRVVDSDTPPATSSAIIPMRVAPQLRIGHHAFLSDGQNNTAYNEALYATGGVGQYVWTIDAGTSLPGTLQLDPNGVISGTLGANNTGSFIVVVADSDSPPQVRRLPLSITARGNGIGVEFFTRELPDGRIGTAYSQQLRASGGTPPITYSLVSGQLPPGVTLSGNLLSGTPTDGGTFSPTFQAKDSLLTTQNQQFTFTIF